MQELVTQLYFAITGQAHVFGDNKNQYSDGSKQTILSKTKPLTGIIRGYLPHKSRIPNFQIYETSILTRRHLNKPSKIILESDQNFYRTADLIKSVKPDIQPRKIPKHKILNHSTQLKFGEDMLQIFLDNWIDIETVERVKALLLDFKDRPFGMVELGEGDISSVSFNTCEIANLRLKANCQSIILAHNHPSNNKLPSDPDKNCFYQIHAQLGTFVRDQVIITKKSGYYSYKNELFKNDFLI